jgi:hypothetical protein
MAAKTRQFHLIQDRRGVIWDVLLYVPTAAALLLIALKLWYGSNSVWAYGLVFLASYFFIVGVNRVLRRLILLPTSPVSMDIDKQAVFLNLKNAQRIALVKDVRFFPDYSGKSFGLSGIDMSGKSHQYVFHMGQYSSPADFQEVKGLLSVYR